MSIRPAPAAAPERNALALAIVLAGLAGWVDAVGFVHWRGLFVSFMSGNTTQSAAAIGIDRGTFVESGGAILVFVAGVFLGELFGPSCGRWRHAAILAAEAALLWGGVAASLQELGEPYTATALGLAMGLQNAALHEAGGIAVSLTFVTGTLVKIGRGLAEGCRGATPFTAVLPNVGLWLGLFTGATLGAVAARTSEATALGFAAALATALAALSGVAARRRGHSAG